MKEYLVNEETNVYIRAIQENDLINIREHVSNYKQKINKGLEFEKEYNINIKKILAFGDVSKVSYSLLKAIIPEGERNPNHPTPVHGRYKCFVMDAPTMVIHEDVHSAWNCLIEKIGNPTNAIIYTK